MPTDKLGAWTGDDLKRTLDSHEGVAYYADSADTLRFTHGVAKLLRKRLARASVGDEKGYPSIFILGPTPDHPTEKAIRVPRLNAGISKLAGHVWFLSREPVAGNGFEACFANDSELFDFAVIVLKAGEMPAVFFDADENTRMVRIYPNGLQYVDNCLELAIDADDVTPPRVKSIIDHIHQSRIITPEAGDENLKLWIDKEKHQPIQYPEAMIQSHLITGLSTALIGCRIRKEQTGVSGRYDIAIEEQDPMNASSWIQHAILELKVIKSFTSTGKEYSTSLNLTWLESGMDQAHCYRNENGSKFAALCCFDMQKTDYGEVCFDHISENAKILVVELWRWYVYATSKEYRTAYATKDREVS